MSDDYALGILPPVTPSGNNVPGMVQLLERLPGVKKTWQRVRAWDGDSLSGDFKVYGDLETLRSLFWNLLCWDVRESVGGPVWRGFVSRMNLSYTDEYEIGIESVATRVKARFRNLVANSGFETAGSPTFQYWSEVDGSGGSITAEATKIGTGTRSARLVRGPSDGDTYIYQTCTVRPHHEYEFAFQTRGEGVYSAFYEVWDASNSSAILGLTATGVPGSQYQGIQKRFITPANCTSLQVRFYVGLNPGATDAVYIDDVTLLQIRDGRQTPHETDWAVHRLAAARFGRKDYIHDAGEATLAGAVGQRDVELARRCYPQPKFMGRGRGEAELSLWCAGYATTFDWIIPDPGSDLGIYGNEVTGAALVGLLCSLNDFVVNQKALSDAAGSRIRLSRAADSLQDARVQGESQIDGNKTAWSIILKDVLPSMGDRWRFYVDGHRRAVLAAEGKQPIYYYDNGEFFSRLGEGRQAIASRLLRPGLVRNVSARGMHETLLDADRERGNDFILDEVRVNSQGELDWNVRG